MPHVERNSDSGADSLGCPFKPKLQFRWGIFVVLLLATYVARGVLLACVVPPLEMWDEFQHVAYIDCVTRTGRSPVFPDSRVDATLLNQILKLPTCPWEWRWLSRYGELTYAQYWQQPAMGRVAPDEQGPQIYEAQQPPLYYWLAAPVYRKLSGDLPLAVAVLRLINVGLTAIGLGAILLSLGRACRDQRHAALLGLSVVMQPLFLLNADRVANDGLAVMLGSLSIVWAMSLRRRFILIQSLGLGLLIGLGVMAKATDLVLLPFAEFCLVLSAFGKNSLLEAPQSGMIHHGDTEGTEKRRKELSGSLSSSYPPPDPAIRNTSEPAFSTNARTCVAACVLLLAGTAIVTGQYFLWSLHRYGTITPMQEAVMNHAAHVRFADYLRYAPLNLTRLRAWRIMVQHWIIGDGLWVGGWSYLQPPRWLTTVYEVLLILGISGWILPAAFRRLRVIAVNPFTDILVGTRILVLCLLMLLAMSYHAIQSMVAWQGASATTPWYASVAVPWFLIGVFSGPLVFRGTRWGRFASLVVLLVPLLFLGTETYGVFFQMVPRYSCLPMSANALRRLATLRPGWLGLTTLAAALGLELSLFAVAVALIVRSTALRARR